MTVDLQFSKAQLMTLVFCKIGSLAECEQLLGLVLEKNSLAKSMEMHLSITNLVTGVWLFLYLSFKINT